MPEHIALARMGKLVAAEVSMGQLGAKSRAVSQALEARPEAALDVLEMLLAEASKKRRNEKLLTAYTYMLGQALECARLAAEGGFAFAAEVTDSVRHRLLAAGNDGQIEPALLLMLLREFASAQLDPGPELRALVERSAEAMAPDPHDLDDAGDPVAALHRHLEDLAQELDGDSFALCAQMQEMANAFPDDQRAAFAACVLQSGEEAVREAALGWVLDARASVRNATASAIEHAAAQGGVSGAMLRRLIAIRNWLPEPDRVALDRTIQTCRRKGVELTPWPQAQVREVLTSAVDAAGAQSVFVIAREGRRHAIACLLLKHGVGVRDAWARHGLTRSELDEFIGQLQAIDLVPTSLDYVRLAVAHGLATNLRSGVMPPFLLIDALETAGVQGLQPEALTADTVLSLLEAEADPVLSQEGPAANMLTRNSSVLREIAFLDSWFEADTGIEQLLGTKGMTRAKRIARVRDEILPRRADKWVERLAWTALTLHHSEDDALWQMFYVAARELKAGRAIGEIPLMMHVATQTVEAHTANRRVMRQRASNSPWLF
ncbi:MAG: hypothetical protein JOZ05_19700 [Acetobacteraceae bacterium]|nr:hypothetical protein [Acetobacteraceae bacterium]